MRLEPILWASLLRRGTTMQRPCTSRISVERAKLSGNCGQCRLLPDGIPSTKTEPQGMSTLFWQSQWISNRGLTMRNYEQRAWLKELKLFQIWAEEGWRGTETRTISFLPIPPKMNISLFFSLSVLWQWGNKTAHAGVLPVPNPVALTALSGVQQHRNEKKNPGILGYHFGKSGDLACQRDSVGHPS